MKYLNIWLEFLECVVHEKLIASHFFKTKCWPPCCVYTNGATLIKYNPFMPLRSVYIYLNILTILCNKFHGYDQYKLVKPQQ